MKNFKKLSMYDENQETTTSNSSTPLLGLDNVSGLLLAKRRLYSMLIEKDGSKNESGLTSNEIEIMYLLSCDKQIQDHLTKCNNR